MCPLKKREESRYEALKCLNEALDKEPFVLQEIAIVFIQPEFTQLNNSVRELLLELKIEYTVYD
jgi:hypothetical protein